ncbi:unnamed protein product [Agarophyton chilense]
MMSCQSRARLFHAKTLEMTPHFMLAVTPAAIPAKRVFVHRKPAFALAPTFTLRQLSYHSLRSPGPTPPVLRHVRAPLVTARLTKANVPMILTYARVVAVPVLATVRLSPPFPHQYLLSALIFAFASLTDFLDGYLARRWRVVSELGTFLDPVADKLMVAVALTLITARLPHPLIVLSTAVIVSREIFVSALREWMAILDKSAQVKVSIWGKLKTATQMVSLTLLLATVSIHVWFAQIGIVMLLAAATLAITSATEYVQSAIRAVHQHTEPRNPACSQSFIIPDRIAYDGYRFRFLFW